MATSDLRTPGDVPPAPARPGRERGGLRLPPRRTKDGLVAGVASGLAAGTGIDPFLLRWGFALLGLAGGVGVAAYLGAWALMDPPDAEAPRYAATP
ncbi:MAG TPA: PspC domain-containing protein, partial [Egibacteraceae bacterium]|nr:PspC domain-containing protein [Egibacteraceae bacterium]